MAIAGIASAIPGIAKGIGSLFGGGKRRRRERKAQNRRDKQMRAFEATEFTNPYQNVRNEFEDMENSFEDLRVSTEAADFQAQQQQQGLASALDSFRSGAGGSGAAAIAQALSQQQAKGLQGISANIAQQEAMNEQLSAQGAMKQQELQAKGAMEAEKLRGAGESSRQQLEMGKQSALLGMANQDLASATRARAQAKADLVGGIGAAAGAAFSAFGGKIGGGAGNVPSALGASTDDILTGNFVKSPATFDQLMNRPAPTTPQLNLIKYGSGNPFSGF
jgi:hypothetical protein